MSHLRRSIHRLANVWRGTRAEQHLSRELSAHLRLMQDDFERRGMAPEDARVAARRAFGGVDRAKDLQRDARSFPWLEDLRRDLAYAGRTLRRSPGFTIAAILTLALGIGANTAIFSVVNAVLVRPLPYPRSDRLVRFVENTGGTGQSGAPERRSAALTLSDLASFREEARSLSHVGIYAPSTMIVTGRGDPFRMHAVRLSPAVLQMVDARPVLGRIFDPREERTGADPVAVLSYASWQRHFAGASDVLGQHLTLDGRSFAIVGVMPAGFRFPDSQAQVWLPYTVGSNMLRARVPPIARVADGVSMDAAAAEVDSILRRLGATFDPQRSGQPRFELEPLQEQLVSSVRPALNVLAAAVWFVLLIACVNVANLVLARSAARQREMVVRTAIGAGRARLVRQLLTESMLLAVIGGVAAVGLAFVGIELLQRLAAILPRADLAVELGIPRLDEIGVDARVLVFAAVVTAITGLISGLAPAIGLSRTRDAEILRSGNSLDAGVNPLRRHRMQGALVIAEIALAMLLLVCGGLLVHSFLKLSAVKAGFDPAGVLTFAVYAPRPLVAPGSPASAPARAAPTADDILTNLQALPEVSAAGYAELLPFVRFRSGVRLRMTPDPPSTPPAPPAPGTQLPPELPDTRIVSRDFLPAMGIRVVEGRGFGPDDTENGQKVLLINRTLARSGFLGPHPIGTRVYAAGKAPWLIVGIVDDVRQYGLDRAPDPQIFIDARQLPISNPNPYFAVRTNGNVTGLVAAVRGTVKRLNPDAIVDNVASMDQLVSNSMSRPRLNAVLMGIFAVVAAMLSVVGVYGVIAYSVARRTREIGIRVALGAKRGEIIGMILGQAFALTLAGMALGLTGAALAARYLERLLFGLRPLDPLTFVVVSSLFIAAAMAASYIPARRATKIDPMSALRAE
jgi:putative ABC transport system permease protein